VKSKLLQGTHSYDWYVFIASASSDLSKTLFYCSLAPFSTIDENKQFPAGFYR